ncbi:MAG: hypothetical protein ACRENI_07205 [Gemmatimonadaceae bacterium]
MPNTAPPFALTEPVFPFPALAALAARGQLGADREVALAAFMVARLALGAAGPGPIAAPLRAERAAAACRWLSALALPVSARAAFAHAAEATAGDDRPAIAAAVLRVITVADDWLDRPARSELTRLVGALSP